PITRLSNGQLKKVIILRQIAKNIPRVLLLDYPFDGLDAESRRDLSNFLDDLATKLGIQLILVDHGHKLPAVISKRVVLHDIRIGNTGDAQPTTTPITGTSAKDSAAPQTNVEPLVEMRNLTIAYGNKVISSNLYWRINKGE